MRLHFQRIFDNPLSKYPISKLLECIGYIYSYLAKLQFAEPVTLLFQIRRFPVQSLLMCSVGLGTQPHNEAVGELLIK